jgi:membrane protein
MDETDRSRMAEEGRGRQAEWPQRIPAKGWWDIFKRLVNEISTDRVLLIAAGATFYLLLALFPALAAFVSIYGLVADPVTIADHIAFLGRLMPQSGVDIVSGQLKALASAKADALSFGFVFGLIVALWSANSGIKTLFEAMNIAYEEKEERGFIWLNLLSLLFTLGAMVIGALLIVCVGVVPAALALLHLGDLSTVLIEVLRWPALLVIIAFGISIIYRFGPSRRRAKWRWQLPGAAVATIVWVVASILFSWYLKNFANYNATYGSLGAVIGFLMWTWISVVILLMGAEFNAELEHQIGKDSTIGKARPLGKRGAEMADTIGVAADEK